MNRSKVMAGLLLGAALTAAGCARGGVQPPAMEQATAGVSEAAQVQRVLDAKCTQCHGETEAARGLRLDSWDHLFAGSAHGEAVIPYDADNSLLIELATKRVGGAHPTELDAEPLTPAELDLMRRWIDGGARNEAGAVAYAEAPARLYVCNQDAALVSVIDVEAQVVIRTIDLQDLGFSAKAKPHHTAVEPDGSFWYLSLIGENKVLKFNRDDELVGQADFEAPGMLARHPTEDALFVGRSMSAVNPPQRIGVIRRSDMKIEEIDVFYPRPHALAVDPGGAYVYSASLAENRLATVNTATEAVELTTLDGPIHTLVQYAVSPDGATMVAGGQLTGQMLFFDLSALPALRVAEAVPVGAMPWHPVFTPDGRFVYVGNKMANTVTVLDVERRAVVAVIEGAGLSQPHGSVVSPDGRYVFVSNNNLKGAYTPRYDLGDNANVGTVVVINTATRAIEKVIEVEANAAGLSTRAMR